MRLSHMLNGRKELIGVTVGRLLLVWVGFKFGFIGESKNETVGTSVLDGPQISLTRQRFLVERWRTVEDAGPYIRGEPHR